ncbi:hypothetical protein SHKM778_14440 [Streptomyces sp. KM77-8]|uniref:Dihydropteroate synthase n=1 Tax=Streptomyces haneummycinicus TaxID=3074435 RepID=A0AAT9HCB2_9ACTN
MLRLGKREFGPRERVIMAIVNRTPDSFYDRGATFRDEPALTRVEQAVADGAEIIDIGGVKAGPGEEVTAEEEARRTVGFVAEVRRRFPDVVISVDTWRHDVGEAVCEAGADVLNDAWGGVDPRLAEVAARYGAGLVCTHAGGARPRTRPHRVSYDDVMADILRVTVGLAERAVSLGVPRESVMIDPGHDFGKNTRHSLEATRRLEEMVSTGWPVLVSLSNKDFVGRAWTGRSRSGWWGRWRRPRCPRGWGRGCTGCTRWPRPGRCWTWCPRSPGSGTRLWRGGGWRRTFPPPPPLPVPVPGGSAPGLRPLPTRRPARE